MAFAKSRYLAVRNLVLVSGRASGSFVARTLRMGFYEAMTHLDLLEEEGVIGPRDASGRRAVLRQVDR